jgi:formylmethanofuran dehydrogenase subunit D
LLFGAGISIKLEIREGSKCFPLLLTTGRILSQYNVGAQTRRTKNVEWHREDMLEIHPSDAEMRGIQDGDEVTVASRIGTTLLHAHLSELMAPGVVYTTFHYPVSGANVVTTEHSLDYVLLFVPNESITGFIHEADPNLIDWALAQKVVLCSPLNLYAFLVVIRQATESFHTEQAASHMMQLMNKFKVQWEKYVKSLDQVKKSFDKMQGELDVLTVGARYKKLAGEVKKIDDLRKQQNVPELPASELADDEIEPQDADEDETD